MPCSALLGLACLLAAGQPQPTATQDPPASAAAPAAGEAAPTQPGQTEAPPKRVFGVLPNYRTAEEQAVYTPISTKRKWVIGLKDSFDYPLMGVAAIIAGIGQLSNANPSFGQGMAGYGRRLGTSYCDQAVGNLMTESIFPSFLHEDPRYFRRGHGSVGSRTWYALTRVMVTHTDSGGRRFNYSEWLGNATGVAISNSYYPDNRNAWDNVEKLLQQVATDAISQVLKEFWPDIRRKLHHQPAASAAAR